MSFKLPDGTTTDEYRFVGHQKECPNCNSRETLYSLIIGSWWCTQCATGFINNITDECPDCGSTFSSVGGMLQCPACGSGNIQYVGQPRIGFELEMPRLRYEKEETETERVIRLIKQGNREALLDLGYSNDQIDRWFEKVLAAKAGV